MKFLAIGELSPYEDPRTQDADKYFLGDRFHEQTVREILIYITIGLKTYHIGNPTSFYFKYF